MTISPTLKRLEEQPSLGLLVGCSPRWDASKAGHAVGCTTYTCQEHWSGKLRVHQADSEIGGRKQPIKLPLSSSYASMNGQIDIYRYLQISGKGRERNT